MEFRIGGHYTLVVEDYAPYQPQEERRLMCDVAHEPEVGETDRCLGFRTSRRPPQRHGQIAVSIRVKAGILEVVSPSESFAGETDIQDPILRSRCGQWQGMGWGRKGRQADRPMLRRGSARLVDPAVERETINEKRHRITPRC